MYKKENGVWSFNTRDLMRAANCEHCVRLAAAIAIGAPGVKELADEYYVEPSGLAIERGNAFESELERELVSSLPEGDVQRPEKSEVDLTVDLMKVGVPVIYQGALNSISENTQFNGRPDFLVRSDYVLEFIDGRLCAYPDPEAENTGYIAWDAKLAKSAKSNYLLQVALYVDSLEQLGFKGHGQAGLILGSRKLERFDENEIVPAMKLARSVISRITKEADEQLRTQKGFGAFELSELQLFCETTGTCDYCEYPALCEKTRIDVDHLSQVFNIRTTHIKKLADAGIATMRALAAAEDGQRPEGFVPGTFDKLRRQAKVQIETIDTGKPAYELLSDPEISVLPPASPNDIFFDMEGFPYFEEEGGLEYLFGATDRQKQFTAFWAHDRKEEAEAFASFVDFAVAVVESDPTAHIYHYANYEVAALSRLATRHGIREKQIGDLIASGRMIDLAKVVTGSLVIGKPSYSIKKLEDYYEFGRGAEVTNAKSSMDEYERYTQLRLLGDPKADVVLAEIGVYNKEDCISTEALYNWLSSLPGAHVNFDEHRKQVDIKKARSEQDGDSGAAQSKQAQQAEAELEALIAKTAHLEAALADWPWGKDPDGDYRARIWQALTHSMLFYNRERVAQWQQWALLKGADDEALDRDRQSLVVRDCVRTNIDGNLEQASRRVKVEYEYHLADDQACFLKSGDSLFIRYSVGANQFETDRGEVISVENDTIRFVRKALVSEIELQPDAIFEDSQIHAMAKPGAVASWVEEAASRWGSPNNPAPEGNAVMDLLMRRKPRLMSGVDLPRVVSDDYLSAIASAVELLDNSTLAIQGPPGTGKTYLASRVIKQLIESGASVGVTANSHPAINNLLAGVLDAGVPRELVAKRNGRREVGERPWVVPKTNKDVAVWRRNHMRGHVVGGTSWNFASDQFREQQFDYLFIDEAAQFSLVDAIAAGAKAKNIVLLGDPQQLTQVIQAIHPGGVANSALGHYMGDYEILPDDFGYFVEVTRRMHSAVNHPISWLSYQGRLHAHPDANARAIDDIRPGFTAVPVEHHGNSSHSPEEVNEVLRIVELLSRRLPQGEIMVVAPFNAQVSLIRQKLDFNGYGDVEVGTVDKFQGREAMAVIVSLASSSADDAPRGLGFVLDRNRLNVALSRAKTNSYLVYSPQLLKSGFANVEQLTSVSRLAGLLSMAKTEADMYLPQC